ncbi:hypothetical protein, partial [Nocardioides sp.]|uniref:hypothetical protein n=1 Tax=Nocardioides sp. TaxID=35761 RepID=UPI00271791F6
MVAAPLHAFEVTLDASVVAAHDLVRRGRIRRAIVDLTVLRAESGGGSAATPVVATALLAECHLAQGDLGAALALGDELA